MSSFQTLLFRVLEGSPRACWCLSENENDSESDVGFLAQIQPPPADEVGSCGSER